MGMEFSWRTRSILGKSKSPSSNITREEFRGLIPLKRNKEIRVLQVNRGKYIVMLDGCAHKQTATNLLESGVYETLHKDLASQIDRRIHKILFKHLPTDLKRKLTFCYSKSPHLYGLPKIHKQDILLTATVSPNGSPCYAIRGFLLKILSP
jgi:hypothetical protein